MAQTQTLLDSVNDRFGNQIGESFRAKDGMVTMEFLPLNLMTVCQTLRDAPEFAFETLIDVCGVDYQDYGVGDWRTEETTTSGFSRGVQEQNARQAATWEKARFAVVYHLLSVSNNQRIRLRVLIERDPPLIPSVIRIWRSADWYEREAFDLYGIIFDGHPDLRRLLTDYGFVGHPFRKDFPLIGQVELRYDAMQRRCVYEPVSIQPRVLVPKVIRKDNRCCDDQST